MKVLLVGNYEGDRLRSMDRFCGMLLRGLREQGVDVDIIRPAVILGGRNKWLGYFDKFVLFRFALRRAVNARPGCVAHIVDQGNGIYAGWVAGPNRCIVTCHDLLAIRAARGEFPRLRTGWTGRIFQRMILRGLRKAGRVVCVSRATQRDAERLIGKSEVIANGLEDFWKPLEAEPAEYLLHVGGGQWYKNRAGVVRVFIELRTNTNHSPKLVMVGPELDGALAAELKKAGLSGEVTVSNGISDEALRALYAGARLLIFPSLEEGFGWPILEAQACGCPVVTTDKEPMRETGGEAAIFAAEGEWAKAVAEVLALEPEQRAALVAAGIENARRYPAARMAREYIEFYRRNLE